MVDQIHIALFRTLKVALQERELKKKFVWKNKNSSKANGTEGSSMNFFFPDIQQH